MNKRIITLSSWELSGKLTDAITTLQKHSDEFGPTARIEIEDLGAGCDTCGYGGGLEITITAEE